MQTFLPFDSFEESARALDDRRLGKQRVETLQIMKALIHPSTTVKTEMIDDVVVDLPKHRWYPKKTGWVNHPATVMWRGYEWALLQYQYAICSEWHIVRGKPDTCLEKTYRLFWDAPYLYHDRVDEPWWFGIPEFHQSHRSNLLRKDFDFYSPRFESGLPDNLPYIWPKEDPASSPIVDP